MGLYKMPNGSRYEETKGSLYEMPDGLCTNAKWTVYKCQMLLMQMPINSLYESQMLLVQVIIVNG